MSNDTIPSPTAFVNARPVARRSVHLPTTRAATGPPSSSIYGYPPSATRESLKRLDLQKILSEPPAPIPWLIEPWLVRGDFACLAAEPKIGKSWIALDLAVALATGGRFLGSLIVAGGLCKVLYLDQENNQHLVARRFRLLASGLGLGPAQFPVENFRYIAERNLRLDGPAWGTVLREAETFRPDLIILDSLVRFHHRDENSNSEMSAFYCDLLKPLAAASGGGLFGIHHLSKPGGLDSREMAHRVRGASDILAEVDQLWTLAARPDGTLTLRHERSRWAETASDLSVFIEDLPKVEGVRIRAIDAQPGAEAIILRELGEARESGLPRKDIVSALQVSGFTSGTRLATKILGGLHQRTVVRKRSEGREARYWLAGHAPEDAE